MTPATVSAYRSALAKPLKLVFNIDVSQSPFVDFVKALFNIRPSLPCRRISWSLDKVLNLALSSRFQVAPSIEDLFLVTLFLTSLATGNRISEIGALLRDEEFLQFTDSDVTFFPNPSFLAKNECPQTRRDPIVISRLRNEDGTPHPLCPVNTLQVYLTRTARTRSFKVFVHPVTLQDVSIQKLRLSLCKFIRMGDPGSFPKSHDLRKYASSFAFLSTMTSDRLCSLVGWKSIKVFKRHYLRKIQQVSAPFIAIGSRIQQRKPP